MSATDELRRMLDESGVEWEDYQHENHTWWLDGNDVCWHAENRLTPSGMLLKIEATITPAQAIDATVGRGMCQMECAGRPTERTLDVMGVYFCSKCGSPIYNDCMPSYCIYCGAEVTL